MLLDYNRGMNYKVLIEFKHLQTSFRYSTIQLEYQSNMNEISDCRFIQTYTCVIQESLCR